MRKALSIVLLLFGASDIVIGLLHIALGPAAIPGAVPVNATMDSEDRFYATFFLAYGVALIWCARALEPRAGILRFLLATFFAGGVARLVSIGAVGLPHPFFVAMTMVELVLPVVLALMLHAALRRPPAALAP